MAKTSAGILPYRHTPGPGGPVSGGGPGPAGGVEVFLVHPGGPLWEHKDAGAWSIAKGLVEPGEDLEAAARREFAEETGVTLEGKLRFLGSAKQPSGKTVHAFTIEVEIEAAHIVSNTFEMEWPPKSGTVRCFPEVDAAAWFPLAVAHEKALKGQRPFLDRLAALLESG